MAILVCGLTNLAAAPQHVTACAAVKNPPNLLVDDWNHIPDINNLSGVNYDLNSDITHQSCSHIIVSTVGYTGGCLQVNYNVPLSGGWVAYETFFGAAGTRNMTGYRNVSFYVKGAAGGEIFKIDLQQVDGKQSSVYISDYLNGSVSSTTWKKVTIPLDTFVNITDWAHLKLMNLTLVHDDLVRNGNPVSGTIYIDNLMFGSDDLGYTSVDACNDGVFNVNATGAATGGMGGAPDAALTYLPSGGPTGAGCVKIHYDLSGQGWTGVYNVVGDTNPHSFSQYDTLTFQLSADAAGNPGEITVQVKDGSGNLPHNVRLTNIQSSWHKISLPLNSFPLLNKGAIREVNFVIENNCSGNRVGNLYVEDLKFEDSTHVSNGDTTPPDAPNNLLYMDSASGHPAAGTTMGWVNWLSVTAPSIAQDSSMQDVKFQYSTDGGWNWKDIATDFDTADKTYNAWWDTGAMADNTSCFVRAVSEDIYGNSPADAQRYSVTVKHYPDLPASDDAFLDLVEKQIFWYYMAETDPAKRFVKDRASNYGPDGHAYSSIAATGAGLMAICIGHSRGWISTTEAYNRAYSILRAYNNAYESNNEFDTGLVHHKGFFYHMVYYGGARTNSGDELSTIDSSLFVACALSAGQYFKSLGLGYDNLWTMADQIYRRMDWEWMRNGQTCMSWGWMPETSVQFKILNGTSIFPMDVYCEDILTYILAAASPEASRRPANGAAGWNAINRSLRTHRGISYIAEGTLFVHQYPQLFVDLSKKHDSVGSGFCYAANTWLATIDQHRYAWENRSSYPATYNAYSWGLGAIDLPYGAKSDGYGGYAGYYAYGINDDAGIIALNNQHTAITELPDQVIRAMRYEYANFKNDIWGKYGFADSYTRETTINAANGPWQGPDTLGIQQGAVLLAIENYRSGLVKNNFMKVPYIQQGLTELGFVSDSTAPAVITDLVVSASNPPVLCWTATGDDGASGNITGGIYEVRFSTNAADTWDNKPWNYLNYDTIWTTNVVAGERQARSMPGLVGGSTYYFQLRLADDSFNWSPVSTGATIYFNPDLTAPNPIIDLTPTAYNGQVQLNWTATGNDGAINSIYGGSYEVRYTTDPAKNFTTADYAVRWSTSTLPGSHESVVITALVPNTSHYFWIRLADQTPNWSAFSNKTTFYITDPIPPSTVTDLAAVTDFQAKLTWTAPGSDGKTGTATRYELRYSTVNSINTEAQWSAATTYPQSWVPAISGVIETKTLTGLIPSVVHYFSLRAYDQINNAAGLSDCAFAPSGTFIFMGSIDPNVTANSDVALGDYNNDGFLDLAASTNGGTTKVFTNDGSGHFNVLSELDHGGGAVVWLDYDRDGSLDLAVAGSGNANQWSPAVYRNAGAGVFSRVTTDIRMTDNSNCGIDAADIDNDGDVDLAITGWGGGSFKTMIWRNDAGSFVFADTYGLTQMQHSSVCFGDYNNDGWQDLALNGWSDYGSYSRAGQLWKNGASGFSLTSFSDPTQDAQMAWGDFDNDGDLDLAVAGAGTASVYRNDGNDDFILLFSFPTNSNAAAWADYNNDGYMDLYIGNRLYRNDAGTLHYMQSFPDNYRAVWGDLSNGGSVDLILSSGVYKNMTGQLVQNNAPNPPSGFSSAIYASSVTLNWSGASDAETPSTGLYYAVMVGTTSPLSAGNANVVSGNYGSPGTGQGLCLVGAQNGRILNNLLSGTTYYWKVRTVDNGLKPGSWSAEQSATLP